MFEAMIAPFYTSQGWIALGMLTLMEVILGVDNIIFISIVAGKLPEKEQPKARNIGLILALVLRIILLFGIAFIMAMQDPWVHFAFGETINEVVPAVIDPTHSQHGDPNKSYTLYGSFSGQSIILLLGGFFLLYKSISEIHHKLDESHTAQAGGTTKKLKLSQVIVQIIFLDFVFSFDSILTAVGLTQDMTRAKLDPILVMVGGVIISMGIMLRFAGNISKFINRHPTIQMLALSFLILIGFMLITESAHLAHLEIFGSKVGAIPKTYLYFAMAFAIIVETLNIRSRRQTVNVVRHGFDRLKERNEYINEGVY